MDCPRLLIIPTEKRLPNDVQILKRVLKSCDEQIEPFDEVILIKNYDHYHQEIFGGNIRTPLTELNFIKSNKYQMCSVINTGFDYVRKKYSSYDGVFMTIMGDDCVMEKNFFSTVISYSDEKHKAAFQPRIIHTNHTPKLDLPNVKGHGIVRILADVKTAIQPVNHVNSLLGWYWHKDDWDIYYDENFNGSWGLKDTDYGLQLIHRGYKIIPMYDVRVWHINAGWKSENHVPISHADKLSTNINWKYLVEKWKQWAK
jgi:hypothetical protein